MFSCDIGAKRYADILRKYALEFALASEVVFAVAATESHFNPKARSSAGALGLMQIMPKTGEWIAAQLSLEGFSSEDLFDPEINVRFGCYYLFYLGGRFSEGWMVYAAYNAGEGVVLEWLSDGITDAESIPFPETKKYVRRVSEAIRYYREKNFVVFH